MTEAAGHEPLIIQNVTAVDGFAYGVIGADVHVLPGGGPLYLLANWPPASAIGPGWSRDAPSPVVVGRGRTARPVGGGELAQLKLWRASAGQFAVRWLYGRTRPGRTALATQFADEPVVSGWKVMCAFHGPDAEPINPGSHDARTEGCAGLLMIVEQADRWLLANLTWLLKNALLRQPNIVTRVLMLARTADAWPRVRGILDAYHPDTSSQHLTDLNRTSANQ